MSSKRTMSDFITGLNGPLPEPTTEYDDTYLLQTTDFLTFEHDNSSNFPEIKNSFDAVMDKSSSSGNFQSWDGLAPTNFLGNDDLHFNGLSLPNDPKSQSASSFLIPELNMHASSPTTTSTPRRKNMDHTLTMEERTRMAAEEDKRRRNTAASARFRVKKKQKEQALEKHAKDMQDKVSKLQKRVSELETENKWLKGLLTDKPDGDSDHFTELFAKFKDDTAEARTDGDSE